MSFSGIAQSIATYHAALKRWVLLMLMAMDRTAIGTSQPYLASRSNMRNRGNHLIGEGLAQLVNDPVAGEFILMPPLVFRTGRDNPAASDRF